MGMKRLIYVSRAAAGVEPSDIVEVVGRAWHRNQAHGLTGLLCMSGGAFMQVLEGPSDALSATFFRIVQDPRHHAVRIVSIEGVDERAFAGWGLGYSDIPATSEDAGEYGPFPLEPDTALAWLMYAAEKARGHAA